MTPILVTAPAVEPLTVVDTAAYLRLDGEEELGLVAALIRSARLTVEAASGCALIEQGWRVSLSAWSAGRPFRLPVTPLIAVERVRALAATGTAIDLAPAAYRIDPADPPRLVVDAPAAERLEIDWRAGFGTAPETVPEPLRQAVRLLVAHWFENRGDAGARPMPADLGPLVAPFRRARL